VASYATPLGALPAGVVYSNAVGEFASVASVPNINNQVFVSTGPNSYTFVSPGNMPSPPFSSGIVQMSLTNVGGTAFPVFPSLPIVGDNNSAYDPAAVVLAGVFTPFNAMSLVKVEWSMTIENTQDFGYANLYLYPDFITTPFGSSGDATAQTGFLACSCRGGVFFSGLSFVDAIPFAICVFTTGTGTTNGINPSDYVLITEYANTNPQPPQSANAVLSDATPVSLFTVDLSGGKSASQYISGTVIYADFANLISNSQTFQILIQYNMTSNSTTCTVGPANALAAAPFLTYTIAGNTVSVNAVGIVGQTFNATCNYTFLQGSI